MSGKRKKKLREFERILNTTSEMLETVALRNVVFNASRIQEKELKEKENDYSSFIKDIEKFVKEHEEITFDAKALLLITQPVREEIEEVKKKIKPYIEGFKKAAKYEQIIEECKDECNAILFSYKDFFLNLKLKKKEIPNDKLRELVTLILLFNDLDFSTSEENFFEDKQDFYDLIKSSEDQVLMDLLNLGLNISDTIGLDSFFEKI